MTRGEKRGPGALRRQKAFVLGFVLLMAAVASIGVTNLVLFQHIPSAQSELFGSTFLAVSGSQVLTALALISTGIYLTFKANRALSTQLTKSVDRLELAQRIGKIGYWEFEISSQKLWWSKETYRMLGLDQDQITDPLDAYINATHPEDRQLVAKVVRAALDQNKAYDLKHRAFHADGHEIIINLVGELVTGDGGNPIKLTGTAQDITREWKATEDLKKLHAEHELIFNNSVIGIAFMRGRTIVRANSFYERLFGYDLGEAVGMESADFFPDEVAYDLAWQEAAPIMEQGGISYAEREMKQKDGTLVWTRISGKIIESDSDEVLSIWLLEDISERRLAEETLRLSEERYKMAVVGNRDAAWDNNLITGKLWLSPVWKDILGLTEDELHDYKWRESIHPDDLQGASRSIAKLVKGDSPNFWQELRYQHRDGRWIWFEARGNVERDENGRALRFYGRITEINRRKQAEDNLRTAHAEMETRVKERTAALTHELAERERAEQALVESESHLKALAEFSPVGLFKADLDGNLTYVNDSLCKFLELDRDQALGLGWTSPIHPDDVERVESEWRIAAQNSEPHVTEYRTLIDGEEHWIYAQARPEKSNNGEITNYVGTVTDITDQKLVENKVKRNEERLRMILDNAADGIITIDRQSQVQSFNRAAEKLFGYPASEVIGHNVSMLMPNSYSDQHDRYVKSYLTTGREKIIGAGRNVSGKRKDGTEFPLYLAVSAPTGNSSQVFTGIVRDMTDVVEAERDLREARDLAEKANRAKSEFLSRMSHELRTPMNAILGFSQLLQLDNGEPLSGHQKEFVEQILSSGRHLLNLINEVLDLAKIEAGGLTVELEDVDVTASVQESLSLMGPAAVDRDIQLINRVTGSDPPKVRASETRLKQIITNLLSNAVKYNVDNGSVTVDCRVEDNHLRLRVKDTGNGIPEEFMTILFEPFTRMHAEESGIEGTGIGLPITKNLVELMGGKIHVDSVPGVGCTFSIDLPLADSCRSNLDDNGPTLPVTSL